MRKRRIPHRHTVRSHKRAGHHVSSYVRGKGEKKRRHLGSRRRLYHEEGSARKTMEDYKVTFYYRDRGRETIEVAARDSDDALNLALQKRHPKKKPDPVNETDCIFCRACEAQCPTRAIKNHRTVIVDIIQLL